jgi:nucleotide-binding universal stress UspA family protein
MIFIKKILCPTDFSPFSQKALKYAMSLAEAYQATLYVQHVVESIPPVYYGAEVPLVMDQDLQKELLERARRTLEDFVPTEAKQKLTIVPVLTEGNTYRQILALLEQEHVDMLVMGTHGRTGLEKFFLGSVTEKIIRKAPCPVLTVCHSEKEGKKPIGFNRILVPIDFSEHSVRPLEYALALAEDYKSQVYVLHVVEELPYSPIPEMPAFSLPEYTNYLVKDAERKIDDAIPENAKIKIEPLVRVGAAHKEIVSVAEEINADLIISGVLGRGAIGAALFGSTTYRVMRSAQCPVLAVRG